MLGCRCASAHRLLASWGALSKSCRLATTALDGLRGGIGASQSAGLATVAVFPALVPRPVAQRLGAQTLGESMRFLSLSAAVAFCRPAVRLGVASGGLWRTGPTIEPVRACALLSSRFR